MKLYAALARALTDHGVDTVFGLLADPTMLFADAFVNDEGGRLVSAAHEAGATHMAYGYAVASGRLGVACIDHGPGLTNALTAIIDAVKARASILVVCPDTVVEHKHYRQTVPHPDLIRPTGAGFEQVRSARTVLVDAAVAIRRAVHEKRPVVLNVPRELLGEEVEYRRTVLAPTPVPALRLDEDALDRAVGLVAGARRPVVLGGRGAIAARADLLALADRIGAPVATTLGAKDLFRGEPWNLGIMGTLAHGTALDVLGEADCVIALGAGLNEDTTVKGTLLVGKRLVHVDADPGRLGHYVEADVALAGDAGEVARTMVEWLDAAEVEATSSRTEQLRKRLVGEEEPAAEPPPTPGTVSLRAAIRRIDEAVAPARTYVSDPGRHAAVTWPAVHVATPEHFVLTAHYGAIGTGMPIAIGAGVAVPERPVLMVGGDGGFMLGGLSELNTAVRHGVDLIVVICNDGAYGPEHQMLRQWGFSTAIVEFDWPDLGPVAEALGGRGITVRSDADLDAALELIAHRTGPVLVDLKLDPGQVPDLDH